MAGYSASMCILIADILANVFLVFASIRFFLVLHGFEHPIVKEDYNFSLILAILCVCYIWRSVALISCHAVFFTCVNMFIQRLKLNSLACLGGFETFNCEQCISFLYDLSIAYPENTVIITNYNNNVHSQ